MVNTQPVTDLVRQTASRIGGTALVDRALEVVGVRSDAPADPQIDLSAFERMMEKPNANFSQKQRQTVADEINAESRREVRHMGVEVPKGAVLPTVGPNHESVDQVIMALNVTAPGQTVRLTSDLARQVAVPLHSMVNPTLEALGVTDRQFELRFSFCGIEEMIRDADKCTRGLGCRCSH